MSRPAILEQDFPVRLLERGELLAMLAAYGQEARRREGRLVLVSGEAGVGKTALLEHLEQELADATWAWGACDGLFTPRPLGPLFDIAATLGGDLPTVLTGAAPREAVFSSVLRRLDVPSGLLVVVVEDVHWADEATLDLLRFLGRRLRDLPVLLLVTFRDDALAPDHPLRVVLGELAGQRSTRRVAVPPLSLFAVRELAEGTPVAADELFRLTGGNPFFLDQVLGAGGAQLPASVRDAVLARVASLSAAGRRVLEAAALAGTRVEARLLAQVEPDSAVGIDECLASGVLTGEDGALRFRHELARLAVEDAVAVHRRPALHATLLAALRAGGCTDDARLAHHAEEAGNAATVLEHAPRAARRAAGLGAHREAAAQYERALRFAAGLPPEELGELYNGLAQEAALVDRWQDAADAWLAALPLWRQAGDPVREGDTLRRLSRALWRLCRGKDAAATAEAALRVLQCGPPGRELAWAYANLANQRMLEGDYDDAIELARRTQELAEKLDLPDVRSDALNTEGCAAAYSGRPWAEPLQRALDVALVAALDEQAGRAYANLHGVDVDLARFTDAERIFLDGVAFCDEHDVGTFATCLRGERIRVLEKTGRWDEAIPLAAELLEKTVSSPINRLNPLLGLGLIRARRGEQSAWALLAEAASAADATREGPWIAQARLARTEAAWLTGRPEEAAAELALVAEVTPRCGGWTRGAFVVWSRRLGLPWPGTDGITAPWAPQATGDWRAAAALWSELGCPYEAAMAKYDSGDATAMREALSAFEALGAAPAARLTRAAMRRLGMRAVPAGPRRSTRANRFGLTRREQEVLGLVAAGLPNADISRRLFISERTVDHHVSAVLAKMGVRSRGQAANVAVGLGLIPSPRPES